MKKATADNANSDESVNVCSSINEVDISMKKILNPGNTKVPFSDVRNQIFHQAIKVLSGFGPWFQAAFRILQTLIVNEAMFPEGSNMQATKRNNLR